MSKDEPDDIGYFQGIFQSLKTVSGPGCFACGAKVKLGLPFPAIEIKGTPNIKIGLPIYSEFVAKTIISKCSKGPREQLHTLDSARFTIQNPAWRQKMKRLITRVGEDLGWKTQRNDVTCQLCKLLLCEPGGFLKRHKVTEKVDGMFGTLVVQLLSDFKGGELVIEHGGKEVAFSFDGLNYYYAAFYADCQFEIKPVTDGYSLCLVYNLLYSGSGSAPAPADNQVCISSIVKAMEEWNEEATKDFSPDCMVYLLDDKYSQASLSFKALKNVDRAIGNVLIEAQQLVDFDLYLAQLSISQTWAAEVDGRYGGYDLVEKDDEAVSACNFITPSNRKMEVEVQLHPHSVVPRQDFDDFDYDEEEDFEPIGNERGTVQRTAEYTALILWPIKKRVVMLGLDFMAKKLQADVLGSETPLLESKRKECLELSEILVSQAVVSMKSSDWARNLISMYPYSPTSRRRLSSESAAILIRCLRALDYNDLLRQLLTIDCQSYVNDQKFCDMVLSLSDSIGLEAIKPTLLKMVTNTSALDACCTLINKMTRVTTSVNSQLLMKELIGKFLEAFKGNSRHFLSTQSAVVMLSCLTKFGEDILVSQFLSAIASTSGSCYARCTPLLQDQQFIDQLIATGQCLGWTCLNPGLTKLFEKVVTAERNDLQSCLTILTSLVPLSKTSSLTDQQKSVFQVLLKVLITAVCQEKDVPDTDANPHVFDYHEQQATLRSRSEEFVVTLLKLAVTIDENMAWLMNAFLSQPKRYPIVTVLAPALEKAYAWSEAERSKLLPLIIHSIIQLESVVIKYRLEGLSLNVCMLCTCSDCLQLCEFLKSKTRTEGRFQMAVARRTHLEQQIVQMKCGLVYSTDCTGRFGSPHTLVVKKTKLSVEEIESQLKTVADTASRLRMLLKSDSSSIGEPSAKRPKTQKSEPGTSASVDLTNET